MKKIFSGEVNSEVHSLVYDLFVHPFSPYWYLFAIFCIYLITGTFADRKACVIGEVVAVLLRVLSKAVDCRALQIVLINQIWLVLGMAVYFFDFPAITAKLKWWVWIAARVFLPFSITQWCDSAFLMGLLACGAIMVMFVQMDGKTCSLAEYMMLVFLMHTIFAAGVRTVLLKLGITAPAAHVILGIAASFCGSIVAAEVMKKAEARYFVSAWKVY